MKSSNLLKATTLCVALGVFGGDAYSESKAALEDGAIMADEAAEAEAAVLEDELDTEKAKEAAKRGEDWFMETKQ